MREPGPRRWGSALLAAVLGLTGPAVGVVGVAAPAYAAGCPGGSTPAADAVADVPWPQRRYGLDRLAGIADGTGIKVAVIDSGVDPRHPQMAGNVVLQGFDGPEFAGDGPAHGQLDCAGHGTAVASIIAARPIGGVGFRGIAPRAQIIPIRVSEKQQLDGPAVGRVGGYPSLAEGVREAVRRGARVINLSLTAQTDHPLVRAQIANAAANGVVLVAAAGNHYEQGNPPSYPAMYPHVIGVGSIDSVGVRAPSSQVGSYVDLVAPGVGVLAAVPQRGHRPHDGTSFAAPFVAGTVALMLQYQPELTPDQVEAGLRATADPAPGGPNSPEYGAGVVNPYRAVTQRPAGPARQVAPVPPRMTDRQRAEELRSAARRQRALALAGVVAALGALILLGASAVPRGARRRWRPGLRRPVPPASQPLLGDP
ncbi:MAG TPA: S8 family serine peptidase [Micromonosporaceae bacterium]|nr:S8 family serine peptidase [Micromonosporaceae bacterium]